MDVVAVRAISQLRVRHVRGMKCVISKRLGRIRIGNTTACVAEGLSCRKYVFCIVECLLDGTRQLVEICREQSASVNGRSWIEVLAQLSHQAVQAGLDDHLGIKYVAPFEQ